MFVNKQLLSCFNRSCLLSNPCPPPPILNRQYHDGLNTNQSQTKNMCPFYNVFQVLKVFLISSFISWCLLAFTSADIIFHKFPFFSLETSKKSECGLVAKFGPNKVQCCEKSIKAGIINRFFPYFTWGIPFKALSCGFTNTWVEI